MRISARGCQSADACIVSAHPSSGTRRLAQPIDGRRDERNPRGRSRTRTVHARIDKILDLTGSNTPAPVATPAGNGQGARAGSVEHTPAGRPTSRGSASKGFASEEDAKGEIAPSGPDDSPAEVVLGPDGEPLADWEVELAKSGAAADPGTGDDQASSRNDRNRNDQNRGEQQIN